MIAALDKRCETVAYFKGYGYLEATGQYVELWGSRAGGFIENFKLEWQATPEKPVRLPCQAQDNLTTPGVTPGFWKGLLWAFVILAIALAAAQLASVLARTFGWIS